MRVNRRTSVQILAGALAASSGLKAQAPPKPQAAAQSAERELELARQDLKDAAERIARVKLPRSAEPAFRFRA